MHKRYGVHEAEKQEQSPGFVNDHTPHHKQAVVFSDARPKFLVSYPFVGSGKCATAIITLTYSHTQT